jgi:predicted nucleic acid-binding protein
MTPEPCFVDSNVPMYAAGSEHTLKAPCVAFLGAVARGEVLAVTSVQVLHELLHRYSALGERTRAIEVCQALMETLPEVLPIDRDDIAAAMALHRAHPTLSTRDLMHLATMRRFGLDTIVTADRHFDGLDGIVRVDPAAWRRLLPS